MNYDLTKWRRLLEEKGHEHYRFNVKKSPREINIEIIEKNTLKAPKGKRNEYGESAGNAHMQLLKRGDNEHWEVASVASPEASSGVGKELYLLALQLTYPSGLSPDSVGQSDAAQNLWNSFLKTHPDVTFEEKEEEVNASADDPFKYVWKIDPNYKSKLDYGVERVEIEEPEEVESEEEPWDPKKNSIDDLLAGIDDYPETFEEASTPEDVNKVSKVIIYQKNGKILLLKRADGENDWDLPGGHLQTGENHEDGARRETKEETNLDISGLEHVHDHQHLKFYTCAAPAGGVQLHPEEHIDFKWVNPRDIESYSMRDSQKKAILATIDVVKEDFQQNVKKNYSKLKFKMIGQGKNTYNVGGKMKKPSYKRSKSAPPGFGGSLEEENG